MRFSASVCHTLRHGVWLVPDDILAKYPALILEGEGDTPWDNGDFEVYLLRCRP